MNKKKGNKLNLISEIYGEKTLDKIDGFDSAVIGLEVKTNKLIYSVKKCVKVLKKKMSTEESVDYFYEQIYLENANENKVIFCEDFLTKN